MKKIIIVIAISFLNIPVVMAAGVGDTYGGIQYSIVTYDEDGVEEADPTALVGRFGQFVTNNVAIEARFGMGLQDDTVTLFGTDIDVEVDSLLGVYGVFHASSNSNSTFYGVLGFTQAELEASIGGFTFNGDESGLSYGIGANIQSFNIEYMSYLDEDDFTATAISFGFTKQF